MKASELIERLGELVKEYGDLDVVYPDDDLEGTIIADFVNPIDNSGRYEQQAPTMFEIY